MNTEGPVCVQWLPVERFEVDDPLLTIPVTQMCRNYQGISMNCPSSSIILRSNLLIALSFTYFLLVGCGPVPTVDESELRVADIQSVFEKLSSDGSYGSYAVFIPKKPDADLGEHLNLQFSYENGSAGFDWVLLSPVNIRDQQRLIDLATTLGITMEAHEMNNVGIYVLKVLLRRNCVKAFLPRCMGCLQMMKSISLLRDLIFHRRGALCGRLPSIAKKMNERLLTAGAAARVGRYRGNIFERLLHFA